MSLSDRERQRLDALVAAYGRMPKDEPPAALDAAILANARAALRPAKPRWPGLLATAATMTIAVGLAWQLRDAEDVREAQRPATAPLPTTTMPAKRVAEPAATRGLLEDRAAESPAGGDGGQELPTSSAPEPRVASDDLAKVPFEEAPDAADQRKSEANANAPVPAAVGARQSTPTPQPFPQVEQGSQASGEPPRRAQSDAQPDFEAQRARTPPAPPAPGVAPASPRGPVTAAAPRESPLESKQRAANERSEPAQEQLARDIDADAEAENEADMLESIASEPEGAAAARADSRLGASAAARAPQDWLDEITRMLRTGQRERAIESLREFRDAYPDAELPPELAELLP